MSYDWSFGAIFFHNTAAVILIVTVCIAALFALALIWSLVNRIAREDQRSRRDEYDVYIFLRESEELFSEYYSRQAQSVKDAEAMP